MPLLHVSDTNDDRLAWYRGVGDPELLLRGGRFVAEGRLVVERLLRSSRFATESVLVTPAALAALEATLGPWLDRLPIYVVPLETLVALTGYNIHRGALAIGIRPEGKGAELSGGRHQRRGTLLPTPVPQRDLASRPTGTAGAGVDDLVAEPGVLVVLERLANADNVGGIFRSALAFGAAAVLLDPTTCDPLYRKAIRTSMGATLEVPFARADDWPAALGELRAAGGSLLALCPSSDAVDLSEAGDLLARPRVALMIGNEGTGLSDAALAAADARLRIPIAPAVDSLNAATAAGIALYLAAEARRHAPSDSPGPPRCGNRLS
jgi:tRNA G18 (ribose-2'-O)-methylase SpoU